MRRQTKQVLKAQFWIKKYGSTNVAGGSAILNEYEQRYSSWQACWEVFLHEGAIQQGD